MYSDGGWCRTDLLFRMNLNPMRNTQPTSATPRPATQEQIAALAHELWRERGCPEGSDIDIWLEAERQLNGAPPTQRRHDSIPADMHQLDSDSDPALNPNIDRQLKNLGGSDKRSPTSFGV